MQFCFLLLACYAGLAFDTCWPDLWHPLPGPPNSTTLVISLLVLCRRGPALVLWTAVPGLLLDAAGNGTPGVGLAAAALTGTLLALVQTGQTRLTGFSVFLLGGVSAGCFALLRRGIGQLADQAGPLPAPPQLATEILVQALAAAVVLTAGLMLSRRLLAAWPLPHRSRQPRRHVVTAAGSRM
ncbi:MAG: hypothetical protein KDA79_16995 [Planctomycetaceae bacterium]|nr:hypothetical protein [Planctomycetaceae bacterium]